MPDYKQLYFTLFNTISLAIERIDEANSAGARQLLIDAHQLSEELHVETDSAEESVE